MQPSQKKYVFIVEDSIEIQKLLATLLESEGYRVDCAINGKKALEKLFSASELPGLILLDLMMPDMDGYEFRRQQEMSPKTAAIPVVVMTADGDVQSKSIKIGAHGFLKKPFSDVELILDTVARFFPEQR